MPYTLGEIRPLLWKSASNVPYSTATADDKDEFDEKLNRVLERMLKAGYSDTLTATINAYPDRFGNAVITVPRHINSILGSANLSTANDDTQCFGSPLTVRGQWFEFQPGNAGPSGCNCHEARALPGKFTTYQDWNEPMLLRIKLERVENGTIIFRGKLDGDVIYSLDGSDWIEGVKLSFTNATVTTTGYFDEPPYAVIKSVTNGRIYFYAVDTDDVESLVAVYDPDETVPKYRRYKVPTAVTAEMIGSNTAVPAGAVNYYTKTEIDAMYGDSGTITVSALGTHDLTVANAFFMRTIRVIAQTGLGAYTHKFTLDNSTVKTGAIFRVRLEIEASTNPTLEFYDESTGGTLLQSITGDADNAMYVTFVFEFNGTNWVFVGSEV